MSTTDPAGDPLGTFSVATRATFGDESGPWLDGVPGLIAELTSAWSLHPGEPRATDDRYVVPSERDGDRLDLEVSYPDGWWAETTLALETWGGDATLRLLERDPRGVRLLERSEPIPDESDDAGIRDACALARRLWVAPPDGVTSVAVEVRAWAAELSDRHTRAGRPFEPELVRSAIDLFQRLGPTQGDRVLLHGDLHLTSLALADDRRVLLGPRPLVGEREFDASSLLRDAPGELILDLNEGHRRVQTRFEVLIDELGCNPTRLQGWAFATAMDQAVWFAENGDQAAGATIVETARMIRALEV
jgi:streptomycin 6-kinase